MLFSCIRHASSLLLQLHQDLVVTAYHMFVFGNSGETAWLSCPHHQCGVGRRSARQSNSRPLEHALTPQRWRWGQVHAVAGRPMLPITCFPEQRVAYFGEQGQAREDKTDQRCSKACCAPWTCDGRAWKWGGEEASGFG
jgi:hypothetical protein